jgi:hypothetical protein
VPLTSKGICAEVGRQQLFGGDCVWRSVAADTSSAKVLLNLRSVLMTRGGGGMVDAADDVAFA